MIGDAPEPAAPAVPTSPAPGVGLPAEVVAGLAAIVVDAARQLAAEEAAKLGAPAFLDARAAARLLSVSPKILRALVRARRVPVVRLTSKTWLFRRAALVAALERIETPARRVA